MSDPIGKTINWLQNTNNFLLLFLACSILVLIDSVFPDISITGYLLEQANQNQAVISLTLSALLVMLYREQHKIQQAQEDLIEKQTEIALAEQSPMLLITNLDVNDNMISMSIDNVGGGPAADLRICCSYSKKGYSWIFNHQLPELVKGAETINTSLTDDRRQIFRGDLEFYKFDVPVHEEIDRKDPSEFSNKKTQMGLFLIYSDITGESHIVELLRLSGNVGEASTFETLFSKLNISKGESNSERVNVSTNVVSELNEESNDTEVIT
ncbi:hypothetical protein [Halorubrum ezzemoulense]|uniref:hypothetical protein n=1 Tax=Halorubrum ezzemoulense TaxID=337243 RepID=UPI00117993F1|nr:hypothetical protein [Halorubrum ezzemoulense]